MSRDDDLSRARTGALLLKTWDDGEAAIVRQLLEAYGIPCQVASDRLDGIGESRILVPRVRRREARRLLAEHRRQGMRVLRGGLDGEEAAGG